jgi:hypothetical protein
MSTYAAPDAVGMGPPPGGPPAPGDPASMSALASILGAGGGGGAPPPGPDPTGGGMPPGLDPTAAGGGGPDIASLLGGAGGGPPGPGDDTGQQGSDLLNGMNSTDHIRAAIKHLMMAMTESGDDTESHGITTGMSVLHGILAGKQKNQKAISAAGG